ncbi:MAG: orotate phosphoribosyltransferase [Elusimicrobiota bacterium]
MMKKTDMLGLLQEHGAIIRGHFRMAAGLHSEVYIQTALLLQYPHVAHKIAAALAGKFPQTCDVVVSLGAPAMLLGQETARVKKCRAIFAEKTGEGISIRRDFKIAANERVLIIQDVLDTGSLAARMSTLAKACGGRVIGVGAIVDRSASARRLSMPARALVSYPLESVSPLECRRCAAKEPLTEPAGEAP